jgi:hypothetical protein
MTVHQSAWYAALWMIETLVGRVVSIFHQSQKCTHLLSFKFCLANNTFLTLFSTEQLCHVMKRVFILLLISLLIVSHLSVAHSSDNDTLLNDSGLNRGLVNSLLSGASNISVPFTASVPILSAFLVVCAAWLLCYPL